MVSEQLHQPYLAAYPAIVTDLAGHNLAWLQDFRQAGLQVFSEHGFPGLREEDWRYTNLSALTKNIFATVTSELIDADFLEQHRLQDAWSVVLVNGKFSDSLSRLAELPESVIVQSLAQALQDNTPAVQEFLGKAVANNAHSLLAFNNAWFNDGVFIRIPAAGQLARPIQILHVVSETNALAATRNLLLLSANAKAEVIETFVGATGSYFTNSVTECYLQGNADLTLYKVQTEAENAIHFGGTYVKQAAQSCFTHHNFALGSSLARSDIHSDLDLAAETTLNGLYLGSKRQHIDNLTRINHLQPQGISREYYKGVLDQRSRGVFQGRVVVAEDAQQTDSEMNNRNLLLSADAEIDTKPQLEIYADDVKCSHGVTVGQLEEKSVFYLQSRGIDEAGARNILTFAFANEMVDKVEIPELKAVLFERLLAHFPAISL